MQVIVHHLYNDSRQVFTGTAPKVYQQIIDAFPWLESADADHHNDVQALVEQLDAMQAVTAEIVPQADLSKSSGGNLQDVDLDQAAEIAEDMLGFNPEVHPAFAAARFLTGKQAVDLQAVRRALYDTDDYVDAAIQAYGLPPTEESRSAVEAVMSISKTHKAEVAPEKLPAGKDIEPGIPDSATTAAGVRDAFNEGMVRVAHLDGKHSRGSLIARDTDHDKVYLLKPGSGGQSPAAGAAEETASQSRRETAFWHIADDWGLGESIPRSDLVIIDGKEYAAIHMLPFTWKGLQKRLNGDPTVARQAFNEYRDRGFIHKWAVLDFVLGNPDRHGDNLMISQDGSLLGLIDHGSAFAGPGFDPAHDQNSFVPFYLRAWAGKGFNRLSVAEKLARMPTVSAALRQELREWLDGIHADHLQGLLTRFGINPGPTLDRLAKVKVLASRMPVDEAIDRLWVTT